MHVLEQLAAANGGLVTVVEAAAAGIDRRRLAQHARTGAVTRVARGVYRVGSVLPDPRAVAASARASLSHHTAAAWWGVDLPEPSRLVHVTVPRNRGRRRDAIRGARLHRRDLGPTETVQMRGANVTTPLRTALDVVRCESLEHGVATVDAFLRAGLLTARDLECAVATASGPGRLLLQRAASLTDPAAGSILESLTRVLLWRNGLPPPVTQYSVRCQGWVGRVDFAWPDQRAILETDGFEYHASYGPFQRDRRRWSTLARTGWRLGIVTWLDVTAEPDYVVKLVRDLLDNQHTNVTDVV